MSHVYVSALKIFGSPWLRPRVLFSKSFMGFFFQLILWICVQNLKFIPLPVPEIIGDIPPKKFGSPWIRPHWHTLNCLKIFNWAFVRIYPMNVLARFEVHSFTPSWYNSDWIFGWGLQTPNLGKRKRRRSGIWYSFIIRKSVGEFL